MSGRNSTDVLSVAATAVREETGGESDVPALAAALIRDFYAPDLFDEGVSAVDTVSRPLYVYGAGRPRPRRNLADAPLDHGPRDRG